MRRKILIVDDEAMIREIFTEAFDAAGFIAHEAQNGRDAFQMIQSESYDFVLSDVRMPGGDGVELAKNIFHMTGPKPQVFLVTGYSDSYIVKATEWGVAKIFDKPFNFKQIIDVIRSANLEAHVHSLG